jgi:hypothetical protein
MQKTHSYPYRVLASWHWSKRADEEELTIKASADRITLRGRGLDRLVEALERGSLEIVVEVPENEVGSEQNAVRVGVIEVSTIETA